MPGTRRAYPFDANDPSETWALQNFCSAKAVFVPLLKRDISSREQRGRHIDHQQRHSPGAVVPRGVGNVQHAVAAASTNDIKTALAQFMNSLEVQQRSPENKESVIDVADVIASELDKPQPDPGKIGRWGKRLIDISRACGDRANLSRHFLRSWPFMEG
jgi:hypothetical protein